MATLSTFRINQPPASAYANWDRARQDIDLYSVASESVECEAQQKTQTSYLWEMISAPAGVTVTVNNSTTHTCNFDLSTRGAYLIRLTVNEGEVNESVNTLYIGIALENTGLCVPALSETNQDNSQSPYTGERGSEEKFVAFMAKVDEFSTASGIGVDNGSWSGHLDGQTDVQGCLDVLNGLWGGLDLGFERIEIVVADRPIVEADAGKVLFVAGGAPPVVITLPESPTPGFAISLATGGVRMRVLCQGSDEIKLPNGVGDFASIESDTSATGGKFVYNGGNIWGFITANGYWENDTASPTSAFLFDGNVPGSTENNFASFDADGNIKSSGLSMGSTEPADVSKSSAVAGTDSQFSRTDHKHDVNTGAASAIAPGDSVGEGSAVSLARSDHAHGVPAFGSSSSTFCEGDDSRLSDTRTPSQHAIDSGTYHAGVSGATEDNFTSFDASGLPKDSGNNAASFCQDTFEDWTFVPVEDMIDGASPPAALVTLANGVGRVKSRAFDCAADEDLVFPFEVPADFDGDLVFRVVGWILDVTVPASGEGVYFALSGYAISMGDNLSGTFGTHRPSSVSDLYAEGCVSAYDRFIGVESGNITVTGVSANDTVMFKLYRDVSDAIDTYSQDVGVSGVWIRYKRKSIGV